MLYSVSDYTGFESGFEYIHIFDLITESDLERYCDRLLASYSNYTKVWTTELNSVWLARHYLAVKMMLSSSVMLTSLEYSHRKNLKMAEPYFLYYSLLNCCRALTFTLPEQEWRHGGLMNMTHQKSINIAVDAITKISKAQGKLAASMLESAKVYRELFSYKFPANGIGSLAEEEIIEIDDAVDMCSIICEITQLNSECMQFSLDKNVTGEVSVDMEILNKCFMYDSSFLYST